MKKQLLFFLLLISAVGSAQVVDIPDAAFKQALLETAIAKDSNDNVIIIDANSNNEIENDEALLVWDLVVDQGNIISLEGISAFANLRNLSCSFQDLVTLDVSMLENLEELTCSGNEGLTTLNISGLNLKQLSCANCMITSLDVSGMSELTSIYCSGNQLTEMDISDLSALEIFHGGYNSIAPSLDFSGSPLIEQIRCEHNALISINVNNLPNLHTLYCGNNQLESLELNDMSSLVTLSISENLIPEIDLSECPSLQQFYDWHGYLTYINLKNGEGYPYTFTVSSDVVTELFVCVDEGEEGLIPTFINNGVIPSYTQSSSYCSFTPGGNYNTITGSFTFDGDNNGCDTDDSFGAMVKVNINDGTESGSTFSNNNSSYNFYTEAGAFTLTPSIENSDWFTITPSSATITFEDDNNNVENQNFCVTANGEHSDVEVVIVPTVPAQPGFNASYKITYRNKGNQTVSGNVFLTYDETILDFVSSTSGVAASTNTFGWSYADLQPFETKNIYLTLKVNAPTDTPGVNIDDLLMFTANITSATGDENPDDNTFILAQTVVGSFDPNDITCLEGEAVHTDKIGEYLHYNINFENTGTAPATFIVVKNEINEEQFDISTLQLMDASHNVETRISGNTVEFYFGDINLAANGGKGNVLFKIKTLDTLQEDDIVMQEANIYFDYNFPIETNEANTTFSTLSSSVFTKDNSVTLYPNPSKDIVNITANTAITSVQLYDVQGRLLQTVEVKDINTQLNISSQPSGLYFVKITTENGAKVEKLVKE